jgi:DNA-binding protein YbaB
MIKETKQIKNVGVVGGVVDVLAGGCGQTQDVVLKDAVTDPAMASAVIAALKPATATRFTR